MKAVSKTREIIKYDGYRSHTKDVDSLQNEGYHKLLETKEL